MRALGGNKILGLAVGERGILLCELLRSGRAAQATRLAEFEFPAGLSPDNPAELGKALGEFLRARRFSARRAVVGLPLRWAVVKPKEVPPADPSALAGMLLLQAEREFALEPQDLVFEYAGQPDPSAGRTVLLLAVQRKRVDSVVATAEAAGLSVEAVTLSAVALASETGRQFSHGGAVLHVAPGVAELTINHEGQPRALRHLRAPAAAGTAGTATPGAVGLGAAPSLAGDGPTIELPRLNDAATALTPELRQVLSLVPQNGSTAPTELVVWDGIGLGEGPQRWGDLLHVVVREQSIESLGVTVAPDASGDGARTAAAPPAGGRFAPAVALALEGLAAGGPATDLLHSRLVAKKPARVGRWTVWAAILGVTFAVAIAVALFDLAARRREVADMKAYLKKIDPDLKEARASIDRTTFAQRWTGTEPQALALLRDVTVAFPEGGRMWATNLTLLPDGRVTLSGRATSDDAPLALLKRLRDSKKFSDVQLGGTQPAGRGSNETAFTINFRYPGIAGPTEGR